jgi:predicted Abi (CAAX) family protease
MSRDTATPALSHYDRYWEAAFNRPQSYPIKQSLDPARYRPVGAWAGRLILPDIKERAAVLGAWFELWLAPAEHRSLVGTRVRLRWEETPDLNSRLWGATRTVIFDKDSVEAMAKGTVLPKRLDGLADVNPLESLAAAHPHDDVMVRVDGPVRVDLKPHDGGAPALYLTIMPVEISAPYYGLVRFVGPAGAGDGYTVRHYSASTRDFSGPEEVVLMPAVVPDGFDTCNSTVAGIERSPCNEQGWYIYGMHDHDGRFVVRSLASRQLLRLAPQAVVTGDGEAMDYLRPKAWRKAIVKGAATQVLLVPDGMHPDAAKAAWRVGDVALLIHLYGGIGGNKTEPAARTPLYWGHFAFGRATVVLEPLSGEPTFDIVYHQVYAHNTDGTIAGAIHYSRYAGDRQYGWAGVRPIQDMLIRLDALGGNFTIWGQEVSAQDSFFKQLEVMEARYRIADGRGGTKVGATNNCAQDSAQALYAAVKNIQRIVGARADVRAEMSDTPEEAQRLKALNQLGDEIQGVLLPWGSAREDWEYGNTTLGTTEGVFGTIGAAVKSWRTMLPPVAARALAEVFVEAGATIYVLRTYQVGGHDPDIEPIVPNI